MPFLQTFARRALLAALTILPLPALGEVTARFDAATGDVRVIGLQAAAIEAALAEPDRLQIRVSTQTSFRGMLVSLSQEADDLIITPRFPLRPGTDYALTLDLPENRYETFLSLPEPEAPAPSIVGFTPSQAVIPANTLRLYLTFSEPMARGQLHRSIKLQHKDGTDVPSPFLSLNAELWDPTQTRATLLLDPGRIKQGVGPNIHAGAPLESGGRYQLLVAGSMYSAEGKALGADATLAFRVGPPERRAIMPDTWQILAPEAGTRAPLSIAFDRIMDSGAVRRLLSVENPAGERIEGRVVTDGGGWTLIPDSPWRIGSHKLRVGSDLEDISGNTVSAPFDAPAGTIGTDSADVSLSFQISR